MEQTENALNVITLPVSLVEPLIINSSLKPKVMAAFNVFKIPNAKYITLLMPVLLVKTAIQTLL
jgi:hypothetical protein